MAAGTSTHTLKLHPLHPLFRIPTACTRIAQKLLFKGKEPPGLGLYPGFYLTVEHCADLRRLDPCQLRLRGPYLRWILLMRMRLSLAHDCRSSLSFMEYSTASGYSSVTSGTYTFVSTLE